MVAQLCIRSDPPLSGASVQIGETTLRFQAFCAEDFDWPDVDD